MNYYGDLRGWIAVPLCLRVFVVKAFPSLNADVADRVAPIRGAAGSAQGARLYGVEPNDRQVLRGS